MCCGLSAWILALAYQRGQATVCDFFFMNGRAIFFLPLFPHGSSFTSLRKTRERREGGVGEGRGGGVEGVSGDLRPPATGPQPQPRRKSITEMYICC